MHPDVQSDFLMYSSVVALIVFLAALIWRSKVKGQTMEHYFAHFVVGNFLMLMIIMNISSFIAEANIATNVHPIDEKPISIIARFLQHNIISIVGFLCACVAPFFLLMTFQGTQFFSSLKNDKGDIVRPPRPAAFFLLAIMSVILVFSTFYIAWGNCALIAKGFKQVPEFNYAVERFFLFWQSPAEIAARYHGRFDPNVEVSNYLGFNMNNSFFLFKVHIITSLIEGVMIAILSVVMGEASIIDQINKQLIDKDKAIRKAKKTDDAANPKPATATPPVNTVTPPATPDTRVPEEKKRDEKNMYRNLLAASGLSDTEVDEYEGHINTKMSTLGPLGCAPINEHFSSISKQLAIAETKTVPAERKAAIDGVMKTFRAVCANPDLLGLSLPAGK